jgi:hypothetical protein
LARSVAVGRFREALLGLFLLLLSSSLSSLSSSPLFSFFSALVRCQAAAPPIFIRTPQAPFISPKKWGTSLFSKSAEAIARMTHMALAGSRAVVLACQ